MNYERGNRSYRGATWGGRNCAKSNITQFADNAACAVDIMVDQFRGVYNKRIPGLMGTSYWAELKTDRTPSRLQTSKILRQIKKFAPCGAQ